MEKVYLETTIPSYMVAAPSRDIILLGHQELTKEWWENERKNYKLFVSDIVIEEISQGSHIYIKKRLNLIKSIMNLRVNNDVENLSVKYMMNFNFPNKLVRDIFHIALSVYYEMDFLLTWNCSHIANAHFKKQLEQYNNQLGYKTPILCTPEELVKFP